ncbi:unnamed protein product [Echinostoma caproni]|uniref:PAM2 domain-containing protein n=1 Tax=Echinostoma caproni TaxID=27848 RepID=A0A183BAA5_9TREM|nr:unnamed protein product [Echinostoma caproni]
MAELFQVSLSERRQLSSDMQRNRAPSTDATGSSIKPINQTVPTATTSVTATDSVNSADGHDRSKQVSENLPTGFSLSDIPLPEESSSEPRTHVSTSCSENVEVPPNGENGEEEFEVLDEYEETGDAKNTFTSTITAPLTYPTPVTTTAGTADYVPMPVVAYSMMQPQFIPAPSFSAVPAVVPDTVSASPSTSISGFVNSTTAIPPYPTPYAIPYGYGCLPSSSFTQVIQAPPPPAPYTPLTGAVTCTASISSSYTLPVEATPPQSTSKAYVPHALHPPTDPPPPYRPYIPTRCETEQQSTVEPSSVLSPRTSRDIRSDSSSSRHSGSSSRRAPIQSPSSPVRRSITSSTASRPESERHSRGSRRNPDKQFRSPPHRARSPHALPHPLEHYQRCLVTALSSDEDRPGESSEPVWSDDIVLKQASHVARVNTDDLLHRPDSEDLDARIARLIGTAARTNPLPKQPNSTAVLSEIRKPSNPLGSPPPPPPPPPTSQRILFTHRPPPNSSLRSSYPIPQRHPNNSVYSSGSKERMHTSSARRSIPPHTPDSPPVRRTSDVDHRLNLLGAVRTDRNEAHLSSNFRKPHVSRPSDDANVLGSSIPPIRNTTTDYVDRPTEPARTPSGSKGLNVSGFDTNVPSHQDASSSTRSSRSNRDEDREIYSMLGV